MYEPKFNSVLVEIDDADAAWGNGNDESMLGKSYRYGTFVTAGELFATKDYQLEAEEIADILRPLEGKQIMWNEGVEAGTVFEHDGKQYGFIYWWDIRGVKS